MNEIVLHMKNPHGGRSLEVMRGLVVSPFLSQYTVNAGELSFVSRMQVERGTWLLAVMHTDGEPTGARMVRTS